jgi:hypothetical protein
MTMLPTEDSVASDTDDKASAAIHKVPMPVEGYVIYSQVALDFGEKHKLGLERQTALNLQIAGAIKNGHLRTYDVGLGLPCEPKAATVYVRPDDMKDWLKSIGYPLEWGMDKDGQKIGLRKSKWSITDTQKLIQREQELRKQKVRNYAEQAAREFHIDQSAARKEKKIYRDSQITPHDPFNISRAKSGKKSGKI